MTQAIRVLLVDDDPTVLQGLEMRIALEPDLAVVGTARNGIAALEAAQRLLPDVVVMDLAMPGPHGLTVAAQLHRCMPHVAVVVLTMYDEASTRSRAEKAGVKAFVGKQEDVKVLLAAIREAASHAAGRGSN